MKYFKRGVLIFLAVFLIVVGAYVYRMLPIVSGYSAKAACSCVFVGERTEESVRENELAYFPQSLGEFEINYSDSSAIGSVLGIVKSKAIYRKGLGCTLIVGMSEDEVREQNYGLPETADYDPDTISWPTGNVLDTSKISGININQLEAILNTAFEEKDPEKPVNTRAVLVVHIGRLVAEKYADGFNAKNRQLGWSMTKSVTNALTGILVQQGKIDLDAKGVFEEWKSDERNDITMNHLLQMSPGLEWLESYYTMSPVTTMLYKTPDMGAYTASFPKESEAGTSWEYSSGTTNMISRKIRQVTGDDYHRFPFRELFHKIGMTSAIMEVDASGSFVGSSYGWATPRDWARFGLLYLNDGVWEGERILPEGWVDYSSKQLVHAPDGIYAAQFWHHPKNGNPNIPADTYFAQGFEEQRVIIIPSKDLVIVRQGLAHFGNFDWDGLTMGVLSCIDD
jgi:CubicO group peptidase (beta-lactamase class C family)